MAEGGGTAVLNKKKDEKFERFIAQVQNEIMEEERAIYSDRVLAEFNNPQNVGRMVDPDAFAVMDGSCGDTMEFYLKIVNDVIQDITFMTDGCGATIACGSKITQMVKGRTLAEISTLTRDDLIDALNGLPDDNIHCAALAVGTLRKAMNDYRKKREMGWK
jgi:nitrogen fixation NifU-like protein